MHKRRFFKRGSKTSIGTAKRFRSEYLFLIQNLSENAEDPVLSECLSLMVDLLTPAEVRAITQAIVDAEIPEKEAELIFERSDDFSDLLTNYFLRTARPVDAAKAIAVRFLLQRLQAEKVPRPDPMVNPFIRTIAIQLGLNDTQKESLYILAMIAATTRLHWMHMGSSSVGEYALLLAAMTGIQTGELLQLIAPQSILMKTELLSESADQIVISEEAGRAIRGEIGIDEFQMNRFVTDKKPVYAIDSFDVESTDREIMIRLLGSPGASMILLYGKPGSGKTELARALVNTAAQKLVIVPPLINGSHQSRLSRVHYATFFSDSSVIIVDEADNILNTENHFFASRDSGSPSKSLLNTFLDQNNAKIIWVVNDYADIHESTLRRFHFKLRFDKLSLKQREHAMDLILEKHGQANIKAEPFIQNAMKDEFITPGILDNVMQSFARIQTSGTPLHAESLIPRLLQSHRPETNAENGLATGDASYQPEILNTSGHVSSVVETAKAFYAQKAAAGGGLNVLLHGLPGTGKTEFVKYIARQTGRDLVFKRGSDLLNMWLGGTEKQIAGAFREAEARGAVLLVDEADTFFQPRESAQRSWEVSQTNEFLNQMENHKIMLFCCTNLIDRLDGAAMRRFHFKLEFRAMREDKRASFFVDYFRELLADVPQQDKLNRELLRLTNLTPGDFRAVRQRFSYKAPGSVLWQELVTELEVEGAYKKESRGRAIGF